jgi:hypothetical protein
VIRRLLVLLSPPARGAEPIPWPEAGKHVGEQATVEGVVSAVHCSPLACSIAFEPTFTRFTAIIQAERFDFFPAGDLEERYKGRRVRVSGTIETIDGKPRMQIASPESLTIVQDEKATPAKADGGGAQPAPAIDPLQAETIDRLDQIISRLDTLTQRLDAAEERMAGLMRYLGEREREIAAAQAAQAPPPLPPGPKPAPAAQALRSLKRGMSANEVERLVGRPAGVIDDGNGWTTWDYGGGHAITFDNRNRVQSLTGFAGQ